MILRVTAMGARTIAPTTVSAATPATTDGMTIISNTPSRKTRATRSQCRISGRMKPALVEPCTLSTELIIWLTASSTSSEQLSVLEKKKDREADQTSRGRVNFPNGRFFRAQEVPEHVKMLHSSILRCLANIFPKCFWVIRSCKSGVRAT
jgi:hypothetical protein